MKRKLFSYNKLIKPICEKITHHRNRKIISWDNSFSENNYKYPNRHNFYYKCKICGYVFFNNKPSIEEIEYIKNCDKENK